jgi:hypothetical protein
MRTIEQKIDELDPELQKLSLQIHGQTFPGHHNAAATATNPLPPKIIPK